MGGVVTFMLLSPLSFQTGNFLLGAFKSWLTDLERLSAASDLKIEKSFS